MSVRRALKNTRQNGFLRKKKIGRVLVVPTFGRQEQADVKFKASLVFRARSIQENPAKKNNNQKTNQKKTTTQKLSSLDLPSSTFPKFQLKFFPFGDRVSLCNPGCPGAHHTDQDGLEL